MNDPKNQETLTINIPLGKVLAILLPGLVVGSSIGGIGVRWLNPPAYDRYTATDALETQKRNDAIHVEIALRDQRMNSRLESIEAMQEVMYDSLSVHNQESEMWKRRIEVLWEERKHRWGGSR